MHIFGDKRGDFRRRVADNIEKSDNIWTAGEVLEDLDLSLNFLLLDRFQDFDDALLFVYNVDSLEELGC